MDPVPELDHGALRDEHKVVGERETVDLGQKIGRELGEQVEHVGVELDRSANRHMIVPRVALAKRDGWIRGRPEATRIDVVQRVGRQPLEFVLIPSIATGKMQSQRYEALDAAEIDRRHATKLEIRVARAETAQRAARRCRQRAIGTEPEVTARHRQLQLCTGHQIAEPGDVRRPDGAVTAIQPTRAQRQGNADLEMRRRPDVELEVLNPEVVAVQIGVLERVKRRKHSELEHTATGRVGGGRAQQSGQAAGCHVGGVGQMRDAPQQRQDPRGTRDMPSQHGSPVAGARGDVARGGRTPASMSRTSFSIAACFSMLLRPSVSTTRNWSSGAARLAHSS